MDFLSMNVYINAWLDCSHPFISIHNKFDDDVLLHFNTDKVNQLLASGDMCVEDFQTTDSDLQLSVIADLLAIQSNQRITIQLNELQGDLRKRSSKRISHIPNPMTDTANNTTQNSQNPVVYLQAAVR